MRHLFCFFFCLVICANSSSQNWDKYWDVVTQYELEGKYKSANEIVSKILKKADKKKNTNQQIKAFLYRAKFISLLEEDSQEKIRKDILNRIEKSEIITRSILQSIYAEILQQYLSANRYDIRKNGFTKEDYDHNDMDTWNIDVWNDEIDYWYKKSYQNEAALQSKSIINYKDFISFNPVSVRYSPTLYDFLIQRGISYYNRNIYYSNTSKSFFNKNSSILFDESESFKSFNFSSQDTLNATPHSIKLYQRLENFHYRKDTLALINVIINRLDFAHKHTTNSNKDQLYINSLKKIAQSYNDHEASALLDYARAKFLQNKSGYYNNTKDKSLKGNRIEALAICNKVLKTYPFSDGGILSKTLKNNILETKTLIKVESNVIPHKPFLARLEYKNLSEIHFNFYKVSQFIEKDHLQHTMDSVVLDRVTTSNADYYKKFELPERKEYYLSSTEVDLPKLALGKYLIVVTKNGTPKTIEDILSYAFVNATDLVAINSYSTQSITIKTLSRSTGLVVDGAQISVQNAGEKFVEARTNINGRAVIPKILKKTQDFYGTVVISKGIDSLIVDRIRLKGDEEDNDQQHTANTKLFLDRAIYRPGQKVLFKGILTETKNGEPSVVPNVYVTVIIYDSKGKEIKEFRLKTNEYGSVHGEYQLPEYLQTGEFSIEMDEDYGTDDENEDSYYEGLDDFDYTEVYFNVEEYKRPKFEVTFEKLSRNYFFNDTISITGLTKSFIGASLSNAKIQYTIEQNVYGNITDVLDNKRDKIIQSGTVNTDQNGDFNITFVSASDTLISRADRIIFTYKIHAEVTDVSGETHEANYTIKIGKPNLTLYVNSKNEYTTDDEKSIIIISRDINEVPVEATIDLKIYKDVIKPTYRDKPWSIVDTQILKKEDYRKKFPYERYEAKDDTSYTEKRNLRAHYERKVNGTEKILLDQMEDWEPGYYSYTVTGFNKYGDSIKRKGQFKLLNPINNNIVEKEWLSYKILNSDFKNNGYVELELRSRLDSIRFHVDAYYHGKLYYQKNVLQKQSTRTLRIPVESNHHNRIFIEIYATKYNSFIKKSFTADLTEPQSDLVIETISFRNRLKPDQTEHWSFKILNDSLHGSKSEVLVNMYDASLDQFSKNKWPTSLYDIYSQSFFNRGLENRGNYEIENFKSLVKTYYSNPIQTLKNEQKIKWFGFNFTNTENSNNLYLKLLKERSNVISRVEDSNVFGLVLDESGLPLPGVNVILKDSNLGTQTDFDGYFAIKASKNDMLVFSYQGFKTVKVLVQKFGTMNIELQFDVASLNEVVVTAQGIKRSQSSIHYIHNYKTGDDVSRYLQGKVAGVNVTAAAGASTNIIIRGYSSLNNNNQPLFIVDGMPITSVNIAPENISDITVLKGLSATSLYGSKGRNGVVVITTKEAAEKATLNTVRSNLNETAFFMPQLKTDDNGLLNLSFESPQALTSWNFMLFAHNKNARSGGVQKTVITQKELSVVPNPPRFLRVNDTIVFKTKVINLGKNKLDGVGTLKLVDSKKKIPLYNIIKDQMNEKAFTLGPGKNTTIEWTLIAPRGIDEITYEVVARANGVSDGEKNSLNVLPQRILIEDTRPLWILPKQEENVSFSKIASDKKQFYELFEYAIQYTSSTGLLAFQALPYLIDYPYDCAEQTFSKFYAFSIGEFMVESKEIKNFIEENSNKVSLRKNEDKGHSENMTHWLDSTFVKSKKQENLSNLSQLQKSSGAFPWFRGGRDNIYITQYIVSGIGQMIGLQIVDQQDEFIKRMLSKAIPYLDKKFMDRNKNNRRFNSVLDIQYLYTRSFFKTSYPLSNQNQNIVDNALIALRDKWLTKSLAEKAMLAIALREFGDKVSSDKILTGLIDQAIEDEKKGIFWKENLNTLSTVQSAVETQALLQEAFSKADFQDDVLDKIYQWILYNKKLNNWGTTKSTTAALKTLITRKKFNSKENPTKDTRIQFTDSIIDFIKEKRMINLSWDANEITPKMNNLKIENTGSTIGSGGVYLRYFQEIQEIESSSNDLFKISKKLYKKEILKDKENLIEITPITKLSLGDLIVVRIKLRVNENVEFIHLKDMRASGLEPIDVISKYKNQNNLTFYQSTRDTATNFFFDDIQKGQYVLEYELRANNSGVFSAGISILEAMYAPQFKSNTTSQLIRIE